MALDYAKLKTLAPIVTTANWSARDTILYALGVGARELDFVYEAGLKALPTQVCVLTYPGFVWRDPALGLDWKRILHAEQSIELHRPLPVEGQFVGYTTVDAVVDKGAGRGAILYSSRRIFDVQGELVATARAATMARGDGGFATHDQPGDSPPWEALSMPETAPDATLALTTAPDQALIYRLSGDLNPLHIDPEVARAAGFERPILHGMCTFGVAGRALLQLLTQGAAARLRELRCRFSAPVYPGETIRTEVWRTAHGEARFRAVSEERSIGVLSHGLVRFEEVESA